MALACQNLEIWGFFIFIKGALGWNWENQLIKSELWIKEDTDFESVNDNLAVLWVKIVQWFLLYMY